MTDAPSRQDIVNCYRLALGRDPESEAVIADKLAQPRSALLQDFFSSGEFEDGVRPRILEPSPPHAGFRLPPSTELKDWAARFVPLSSESLDALGAATSWAGLYRTLFADRLFTEAVLTPAARAQNTAFLLALGERAAAEDAARIEGRVELVTPHELRGWALHTAAPARRLRLELWVEGEFQVATTPDRYRPDLQARFGGHGLYGFALARPPKPWGAGPLRAELREAASGAVVEVMQLPPVGAPPADAAVALRRELAEVRTLLARIEQRLPDLNEAYSFALDLYGDYFDAVYAPAHAAVTPGPALTDLAAVVDACDASPAELERALSDLARQGRPPAHVVVVRQHGEQGPDFEHVLARARGRFADPDSPRDRPSGEDWAAAVIAAAAHAPYLILLDARLRAAPDAAERLHQALATGAALVYADEDAVELTGDGGMGRHAAPVLRTGFDGELYHATGDLGGLLGLSRRLVDALGLRGDREDALDDLVLRALERPEHGGFVHVPRVLAHAGRARGPSRLASDARRARLQRRLDEAAPGAQAVPHTDLLGATIPGALRVRRPAPQGARAAVIVPTRDRVDLLEPCLASLLAAAEHNHARLEILVVDNQSREPETSAFLERITRDGPVRVLAYDGGFNWSLMNNRAAAATDAEVLLFLNNDTALLSRDGLDALFAQALRPEVGAVGARLLYRDGTIQHAGVVMGGWHAFAAHEGVGAPGGDPGYGGRHALTREVSAVTGACLATRRNVFERLGGFDAVNLPVEGNDVDYCLRLREHGLKIIYEPACTLYHYESKSRGENISPDKRFMAEAAGAFMRARWGEAYREDSFYNAHFDRLAAPLARLRPVR